MLDRITYNQIDFSDMEDITRYAYGQSIRVSSSEEYKQLLLKIIEKAKKDNIYLFRKKHDCKYCMDYERKKCDATNKCKYELIFGKEEYYER